MKGFVRSLGRSRPQSSEIRKQLIKVTNLPISIAGTSGVGFGTAVAGDVPEGNILLLGAIAYLQVTSADANIIAAFDGDISVGSAPTADNALAGSEVDLLPSTATNPATAKVSPLVRLSNATQVILDNTDGSLEVNINLLIDDTSISGVVAATISGLIELSYVVMLDD